MKKQILTLLLLIISCTFSFAQSAWQWGKRGGSPVNMASYGPYEDIKDITTDKWGNVYAIAEVGNLGLNIDGGNFNCFGWQYAAQICIVSFNCEGDLRWYTMAIGTSYDIGNAIKTDTSGGVYITGTLNVDPGAGNGGPDSAYIFNGNTLDTVFGITNYKSWFILKLDTAGTYKWLKMPEPDTLIFSPAFQTSGAIDMDADESGNSYILCSLKPGAYANNAFVATDSAGYSIWDGEPAYITEFDKNGAFVKGFRLPIRFVSGNGGSPNIYMKRDHQRKRFYISGNTGTASGDSLFVAGNYVYSLYVACFDSTGGLVWLKKDGATPGITGSTADRATLDNQGNIYVTGGCQNGFIFNGSTFTNTLGTASSIPFLVKLDTNGNNVWATNGSESSGDIAGVGVALSSDTVAVFGYWGALKFNWGTDTIYGVSNSGYKIYLARFNATTGAFNSMDTLTSSFGTSIKPGYGGGAPDYSTGTIAADILGNFYCGGNFATDITIAGNTLQSIGGETDWFVAKFGNTNCSLTEAVPTISHTAETLTLYPNPNNGSFIMDWNLSAPIVQFRIMDLTGRVVDNIKLQDADGSKEISLPGLSSGVYFYELIYGDKQSIKGKILVLK